MEVYVNVRENRRGNQEWTIRGHRQHRAQATPGTENTKDEQHEPLEKLG
jgi:hypothetical protein